MEDTILKVSLATKLRWFDRGAAAFAQVFPDALSPLGTNASPHYVCPQCAEPDAAGERYRVQLFPRTAVQGGALTAEHVPPRFCGGRELVLTCKPCNSNAGSQLEAHAYRRENTIDTMSGVAGKSSRVHVAAGGRRVFANLKTESGLFAIDLPPWKTYANDPKEVEAFQGALLSAVSERSPVTVTFAGDSNVPRRADVTWLRHAYLALFAIGGYRYIFQPGLGLVRKQIKEPEAEHIPLFLAVLPAAHSWIERRIIYVRDPEWLQSWAVQIGKYLVFLPKSGDTELYARLAEDRVTGQRTFSGDAFEWPIEPSFGLRL